MPPAHEQSASVEVSTAAELATGREPRLVPMFPIRAPRLDLRPYRLHDLDDMHAFHRLPEVARFLYWEPRDRDETREVLRFKASQVALVAEGDTLALAAIWRAVGRVVGEVNLRWTSRTHRQGEVGFVFNPAFHGRGLATEAAREMLRLGFEELGLHRIVGRCDARNDASARLLRRLGMRREAHFVENEMFKGEWGDEFVYAMLAREWRRAAPEVTHEHRAAPAGEQNRT